MWLVSDHVMPRPTCTLQEHFSIYYSTMSYSHFNLKKKIIANQVGAAAKPGMVSPCDVWVPKGPTGMDPTQTSFF